MEVVGDGVLVGGGPGQFAQLVGDQSSRGLRVEVHGGGAEFGGELGGAGEQPVPAEDGGALAPAGVHAGDAVPGGGAVHHVVVVERGDVDEFGDGRGLRDAVGPGVAELRAEQDQQGAQALAARVGEVAGDRGDPGIEGFVGGGLEPFFGAGEGFPHSGLELGLVQGQSLEKSGSRNTGRHSRPGPVRISSAHGPLHNTDEH